MSNHLNINSSLLTFHYRIGEMNDRHVPQEDEDAVDNGNNKPGLERLTSITSIGSEAPDFQQRNLMTGMRLWLSQFYGLLVKRIIYTKRRYILFTVTVCTLLII